MFVRVYSEEMKRDLLVNNWVAFKTNYKTDKDSVYHFYIKDRDYLNKFSNKDYEITNRLTMWKVVR